MARRFPLPSPLRSFALRAAAAFALALLLAFAARADDAEADARLDALRTELSAVQRALRDDSADDTQLLALRERARTAQTRATEAAAQIAPQLAGLQARLAELGTPAPGTKEDTDLARQRAALSRSQSALDGQLKLARLLGVEAEQLGAQVGAQRRARFEARLGERTASVASRRFWSELREELPRDRARLAAFADDVAEAAQAAPGWAWIAALLAIVAAFAASAWAHRVIIDAIAARVPALRLRRSLHALAVVLLWAAAGGVAALALRSVVDWDEHLAGAHAALLDASAGMLWFSAYLAGLARALICAARPSWRLLPLPDAVAVRLRTLPLLLATASFASWLVERLTAVLDASLAMSVAVNCIVALALALTLGVELLRAERLWRRLLRVDGAPRRTAVLATLAFVSWLVLAGAIVSLLTGYVAFGSFAVKQVVWMAVLLGSAYVLGALIDDACMAWIAPRPEAPPSEASAHAARAGAPAAASAAAAASGAAVAAARRKAAVLVSALLRVALALLVLMLMLAPFGESPAELLHRTGQWQRGWTVGEVQLRPGALLQGLVVLVLGLALVRLLRRWLAERYLPTTSLDPGMRASATTLFGYAGAVVAVAVALSAIGIGLERVAWVASALSVGIGFGLQAVVQNFVSGLILLAERPVKVGDWVSLGGVEGDIRRINVRATEIQMGDRSTVIVPNSEFITKVVRNVTMAEPLGLVQVKLAVPVARTDAHKVRELLLAAFTAHPQVLDTPAPNVLLDGIVDANLLFNATGFVDSPRAVAAVRSALLFEALGALREAGIALAAPPTALLLPPEAAGVAAPAISAATRPPE